MKMVELATPGTRVAARIVDLAFITALIGVAFCIVSTPVLLFVYRNKWHDMPSISTLSYILGSFLQLTVPIGLLLYDVVITTRTQQTIGKKIANIKVIKSTTGISPGFIELS